MATASAVALHYATDADQGIVRHRGGTSCASEDPARCLARSLATTLARSVRRQVRDVREHDHAIDVETLRAVEPAVARYLDTKSRRRA